MNIYLWISLTLALLGANFFASTHLLAIKIKLAPIVIHLMAALVVIPLMMIAMPHEMISSQSSTLIKMVQSVCSGMVLAIILLELCHIELSVPIVKASCYSALLPSLAALAIGWWLDWNARQTMAMMCIFAITAVPVLYLYLQAMSASIANMKLLMGIAISIDVAAWLGIGFVIGDFSPMAAVGCILLGMIPRLMRGHIKSSRIVAVIFMLIFIVLYILKTYALVFGIVYLMMARKSSYNLCVVLPAKTQKVLMHYIAIPLLFIFAALNISWPSLSSQISPQEFLVLIIAPIASKVLASWLGLTAIRYKNAWSAAWLLNTRGLTEIVVLNILLGAHIISSAQYVALLLMSLVATLIPALIKPAKVQ